MGCFSWIFGENKKPKGDKKKKKRKNSGKKSESPRTSPRTSPRISPRTSPRKDELPNQRETKRGVSFDIHFRPATAKPPPPRKHKFVESLKSVEEKAMMANLRRMEEMVRKGEAAKESDRRREICLEQKARQDRVFREKAQQALNKKVLPDQAEVSANMAILAKRCKTARRRQKIVDVFKGIKGDKGNGEGAAPSPALE